jgi:hypothetical protein
MDHYRGRCWRQLSEVQVRDGNHAGPDSADDSASAQFVITAPNSLPVIASLTPDKQSPQDVGAQITWTATASDPENDPRVYRFLLRGQPVTDWTAANAWTWTATAEMLGTTQLRCRSGTAARRSGQRRCECIRPVHNKRTKSGPSHNHSVS